MYLYGTGAAILWYANCSYIELMKLPQVAGKVCSSRDFSFSDCTLLLLSISSKNLYTCRELKFL